MQTENIRPSDNATIFVECRRIRETFTTLQLVSGVILEEDDNSLWRKVHMGLQLICISYQHEQLEWVF